MDPLYGTQLTDQLMANPWMLDPTQKSNQFTIYNNKALPWPPTYNGVPTDAMGRPIQSFQQWQQQNPGGMTPQLDARPARAGAGAADDARSQPARRSADLRRREPWQRRMGQRLPGHAAPIPDRADDPAAASAVWRRGWRHGRRTGSGAEQLGRCDCRPRQTRRPVTHRRERAAGSGLSTKRRCE